MALLSALQPHSWTSSRTGPRSTLTVHEALKLHRIATWTVQGYRFMRVCCIWSTSFHILVNPMNNQAVYVEGIYNIL